MKAFSIKNYASVYFYNTPVHMSASFGKLTDLVDTKLKRDVNSGDLFLFVNKRHTYLKILYYDKGGYCIFSKMLPKGKFDLPDKTEKMKIKDMENIVNQVILHGSKRVSKLKAA